MNKPEILKQAYAARVEEIDGYQLNIDNYTLAIEHIDASGDADLVDFRSSLVTLLATERLEQKKSKVMLAVIAKQLEIGYVRTV
jgi:hypothetical protein